RPSVFEPVLTVNRSVGAPWVNAPAATPEVASRVVRVAVPSVLFVTPYRPPPARYSTAGAKAPWPRLRRTSTSPETLLVTTMSVVWSWSRSTSARVTSETPRPTGRVTEDGKRALPVGSLPEPLLNKTVRVPAPALRTTRSFPPSPRRSPVTICAGSEPVGSDPIRTKVPSRQPYNEIALSVASTLASTGP